jgi:S1-C subfamily serine protease
MVRRLIARYALLPYLTLVVSCSKQAPSSEGEWRAVGDGKSVVNSVTGEVRVAGVDESPGKFVAAPGPSKAAQAPTAGPAGTPNSNREIIRSVRGSVATLFVQIENGEKQGSGFLAFDRSTLITNFHVIAGAKSIRVRFTDGTEGEVKSFLGAYPEYDLAILHLGKEKADARPPAIAPSGYGTGDRVFAFGAPKGLEDTVSEGIISAMRTLSAAERMVRTKAGPDLLPELRLLQITAPISSGNSGGPVIDERGQVVGVCTFKIGDGSAQNLNFAVDAVEIEAAYRRRHAARSIASLPISTKQAVAAAPKDNRGGPPGLKNERNLARVAILRRFVESHPNIGLPGIVNDCDAQWAKYTARIRRGEVPTSEDVIGVKQLMIKLNAGHRRAYREMNEVAGEVVLRESEAIGGSAEWRHFLGILGEIEH